MVRGTKLRKCVVSLYLLKTWEKEYEQKCVFPNNGVMDPEGNHPTLREPQSASGNESEEEELWRFEAL